MPIEPIEKTENLKLAIRRFLKSAPDNPHYAVTHDSGERTDEDVYPAS
jgi:hypothetical protein